MNPNYILPEELVIQIVARLPVKYILKLKSVCKLWYKLLSEGYFIQLFDQISIGNPLALIEVSDSSKPKHNLLFGVERLTGHVSEIKLDFIKDKVEFRASCNGILCCSSIRDKGLYYVCNPMTRQYKELPRIKEELLYDFFYFTDGEAFYLGLACDLSNQKFSVFLAGLRGPVLKPTPNLPCIVYDSETNTWNELNSLPDDYFMHMNLNRKVFKGPKDVYFDRTLYTLREGDGKIIFRNLNSQLFVGRIPLPIEVLKVNGGQDKRVYMLELDGLLSLVQIAADAAFLTIWVLKDRYIKKWEVLDEKIMISSSGLNNILKDICRISQSGIYMFFATRKEVVMYNRSTKVWTDLFSGGCHHTLPLRFTVRSFRSTLFSLFH